MISLCLSQMRISSFIANLKHHSSSWRSQSYLPWFGIFQNWQGSKTTKINRPECTKSMQDGKHNSDNHWYYHSIPRSAHEKGHNQNKKWVDFPILSKGERTGTIWRRMVLLRECITILFHGNLQYSLNQVQYYIRSMLNVLQGSTPWFSEHWTIQNTGPLCSLHLKPDVIADCMNYWTSKLKPLGSKT